MVYIYCLLFSVFHLEQIGELQGTFKPCNPYKINTFFVHVLPFMGKQTFQPFPWVDANFSAPLTTTAVSRFFHT